ncbi:MAG TPA: CerR family C-terminal domain-containing protein [Caulobacteraceae bacterium]|jgi:AcrR family transcriptional regulator
MTTAADNIALKIASGSGPRRRPEGGGYARGDEVRSRILLAAIQMFGEQGFTSASTRAIAARAGVNPPALQYYFHNKERLHQACGQYIADRIKAHLGAPMERAREALETADRAAAPERLWALMETVVDHSSNDTEIPGWRQFLVQAAADLTDNTTCVLIFSEATQPLYEMMAGLIALAWGRPAKDEAAHLAAVLLLSQTRAFGVQRQGALVMMGWPDFEDGRLDRGKLCQRALMMRLIAEPLPV